MTPALQRLQDASTGLLYISESEHPFDVVLVKTESTTIEEKLPELTGREAGTRIEKEHVAQFFAPMTKVYPGATLGQEDAVKRFQHLQQTLEEALSEVTIYRIGAIQVDVFLIGKLEDGTYGGLKTRSIET